jgi:putative transcriptional regulator
MINIDAGTLLIADPFLKDPNFLRTVVLLCEHNEAGDFGLVLNRLYEHTLDELNADFAGHKIPLYYGGPVEPNYIHFIHQYPNLIPDGIELAPNIFWGGNFETLTQLIKTKSIDIQKIKIFVGYSGWDANQLNEEIEEKTWLVANAKNVIVFDTVLSSIWKNSIKLLGSKYEMLINFPIDPQLN